MTCVGQATNIKYCVIERNTHHIYNMHNRVEWGIYICSTWHASVNTIKLCINTYLAYCFLLKFWAYCLLLNFLVGDVFVIVKIILSCYVYMYYLKPTICPKQLTSKKKT